MNRILDKYRETIISNYDLNKDQIDMFIRMRNFETINGTYILKFEQTIPFKNIYGNNMYYVGKSRRPSYRIRQHREGYGCKLTSKLFKLGISFKLYKFFPFDCEKQETLNVRNGLYGSYENILATEDPQVLKLWEPGTPYNS